MSSNESSQRDARVQAGAGGDAGGIGGPEGRAGRAGDPHQDASAAAPAQDSPAAAPPPVAPSTPTLAEASTAALSLRCDELQAQVTALSSAAAIRADIIEEQIAHIGDLERHLRDVDALVANLQNQLGQGGGPVIPSTAGLRSRAYWGLRRRAGGAVRRLLR